MQAATPLICLGMGSGSGSNLRELIQAEDNFRIALLFADRKCELEKLALENNRGFLSLNAKNITGKHPNTNSSVKYTAACERFEQLALRQINAWETQNETIDLVLLGGYMRLLREPFLKRFAGRMLNVHPGDLSQTDQNGKRLLIGSRAVLKALLLGHQGSRSSIHMVTHEMDAGPILEISREVPFSAKTKQARQELLLIIKDRMQLNEQQIINMNAEKLEEFLSILKTKFPSEMKRVFIHCKEHQNTQKQLADWPSYTKVVKAIARGKSRLPTVEYGGDAQ
tara:strand:- start:4789 stop:5634 length:846 start_codon:yes stop_codon:yes gene_type:complete